MTKLLFFFCFSISLSLQAQINFNRLSNQPPANIYSIVSDPINGDIYACLADGVIKTTDQGTTWTTLAYPGMNNINVLYFSAVGQLYAGAGSSVSTPLYGITKYNKVANTWTGMASSPVNVSAILEDAMGNVYAGTGSTGNTQPNPINFGNGVYLFNGIVWSAINTGMANLTGYAVLPFIKDLKILSGGKIVAATYGNGVLQYSTGSWNQYGTGLSNGLVNCLFINSANALYAGTDAGVSALSGTVWSNSSTGLTASKPVRALVAAASGTMYAGLGFYFYQRGSIKGEIFYSTNNAVLWQNAGAGFNSTTVASMVVHSSGNIFAVANGVWKTSSPNNWVYAMSSLSVANNTPKMVRNLQGDLFVICRNPTNTISSCAGVFRSTDNGVTWVSINNGINLQRADGILVDSQGWLWLTTKKFIGASLNPAFGNPELYYSSDNGNTWIQDPSIENTSDGYNQIAEDGLGRIFVTESFNGLSTNISSSTNHAPFLNNLQPPPNNGGKSFGLGINSLHHIFHGTETTQGLYRSTANGAPGTFISLETLGVGYAPNGNVGVHIDPYTDYIFTGGTHGLLNGTFLSKNIFGSTNIDNGSNLFLFNNLPDYTSLGAMAFDNRGNCYMYIGGGSPTINGLYIGTFPWNANTVFTRIGTGVSSFAFNDFMIDDCGYLFGMVLGNGGIFKSTLPVNTPLQCSLTSPVNNATGVILTPTLTWSHKCVPDSFHLQIATDTFFNSIVLDKASITATYFTVLPAVLNAGTKYYWRVYGVNAAGTGKWSSVNNFTTAIILPLQLINFFGVWIEQKVRLHWTIAEAQHFDQYIAERSEDGSNFTAVGSVTACSNCSNNYELNDNSAVSNYTYYYRLKIIQQNGLTHFSNVIVMKQNKDRQINILPNLATSLSELQIISADNTAAIFQLYDLKGSKIMEEKIMLQTGINLNLIKSGRSKIVKGVYQVVVKTKEFLQTFKLVIQ